VNTASFASLSFSGRRLRVRIGLAVRPERRAPPCLCERQGGASGVATGIPARASGAGESVKAR